MSSKGIMPGWGNWVVNGNGPTSAWEPVRRAWSDDFPLLGGPEQRDLGGALGLHARWAARCGPRPCEARPAPRSVP